ncbi:MAG: DNA polymerase IV [Thermoplasmata archaeon]|nr:DNA polymerase IV [Thermoplasmata archaeon]
MVYVDLDAYYVSCELRDRPDLAGLPVIVGADPRSGPSRGVVLSASYEARAKGVRSAMPVGAAARACPEARWLPPDFPKYGRIAEEFRALLGRHSTEVIPFSIDEAALIIEARDPSVVEQAGRSLQGDILRELRLPSSIGAAPYRVVAKIACERAKPGGVLVVPRADIESFLAPLPIRAVPGVGPKTEALLLEAGIETIGDMADGADETLRRRLGGFAEELVALARGAPHESADDRSRGPHSRSVDRTFPEDLRDPAQVETAVADSAAELALGLGREKLRFRTVSVAIKWADFTRVQRSRSLPAFAEGLTPLAGMARRLFRELWEEESRSQGRAVRFVSVRAERLDTSSDRQLHLDQFPPAEPRTIK